MNNAFKLYKNTFDFNETSIILEPELFCLLLGPPGFDSMRKDTLEFAKENTSMVTRILVQYRRTLIC